MGTAISDERALWLARHVLPCEPRLRRWLSRRVALPHDVDDVVQEVYAVLAALPDVGHINEPGAYLFTTANSIVLQHLRRSRIVSIEALADADGRGIPDDGATPERLASSHQELRRVGRLIRQLPEKCREAFVLRRVEGLSQREIAARMRISENTVEKHICKGIRLLMEAMKQEPDADARPSQASGKEGRHADYR